MNESNFSEVGDGWEDGGDDFGSDDFGGEDFGDDDYGDGESQEHGSANDAIAYLGDLPESFGDEDIEVVSHFFGGIEGLSPDIGQAILSRYDDFVEETESKIVGQDEAHKDEAVASLRQAWGHEYESNIERLRTEVASQPFADDLLDARFPDGRAVFNDPRFVEWLLGKARGANMSTQQRGQQRPANRDALENEMEQIRNKIGSQEYIKSPRMQNRYRELLRLTGKAD